MLIAIGMKISVLTAFSLFVARRSASTAMRSPRTTTAAGTNAIHSRVLSSVCRKASLPSRSW